MRRKERNYNLNPYLTLVLAVQPTVLSNLGERRAYLGNGALERFLYVLPRSKLGHRTHDKPPLSASIQHAYHAKIHALLNLSRTGNAPEQRLLTCDKPCTTMHNSAQLALFHRHLIEFIQSTSFQRGPRKSQDVPLTL